MSNEITIHQKHLHVLICEVFKSLTLYFPMFPFDPPESLNSLNNSNPEFMWSYFTFKNTTYNIRNGSLLKLLDTRSTYYGINSVRFRACLF